jgi:hypothetical protein
LTVVTSGTSLRVATTLMMDNQRQQDDTGHDNDDFLFFC